MSLLRLPVAGLDLETELSIAQFVIPAGAAATFSAANNIGTITFNAAHGLTLTPAAGVPPNYFITFGGSTSGLTGTGILVGNIFRILSIPSTTAITIYTTITAATVTSLTGIPVFFPNFIAGFGSAYTNGPTQTISAVVTPFPNQQLEAAVVMARNAANCAVRVNVDQTAVILDQTTGNTPATAPTWRDQVAASTNGTTFLCAPWGAIWANGTTATSTFSVVN
jgi:hypothetical protein